MLSIWACHPPPARSCPPPPHRTHPAGTLIVATKARIVSLGALRGSPAMDLHQGDYIQLPPAAIEDKAGMAEACGESPRRVAASYGEEQQPELRARPVDLALWGLMDSEIGIYWGGLAQQIQEGLQSDAVGV